VPYLLVVDDHTDTAESLCTYLRRRGHQAAHASGGEEAIRSILDRLPDLIVLDLFMPHMDGADLLDVLRSYSRLRHIPVIVWTAYPDSSMVDRAHQQGVTNVLTKGTSDYDDILAAVRRELTAVQPPDDRSDTSHGYWR
jgi:CheY-like chemotaxis protein